MTQKIKQVRFFKIFYLTKRQKMQKGNSPCLQKNGKSFRLNNYTSWFHSKQKTEALIHSLQTQNKNLIAQNIQLQKQNHELLLFKQKYMELNPEQNKEANHTKEKEKMFMRSSYTDKKYQTFSVGKTEEGSIVKGIPIISARKSKEQSDIDQKPKIEMFNGEIAGNLENNRVQKKKRFNYFSDPDQISIKATFGSFSETYQPIFLQTQSKALQNSYGKQPAKSIQLQNKIAQREIFATVRDSKLEISSAKAQSLEKELIQMRRIQGQLLNRIGQRDQIIEKLKNLLHSPKESRYSGKNLLQTPEESRYSGK